MSRLSDSIRMVVTGRDEYVPAEFRDVTDITELWSTPNKYEYTYRLGASFTTNVSISKIEYDANPQVAVVVGEQGRNTIVNAVFGEFRNPLHEIIIAVEQGDNRTAREKLSALYIQMFQS